MAFNKTIDQDDIRFYISVLDDEEKHLFHRRKMIESIKALPEPPDVPYIILKSIQNFLKNWKDDEVELKLEKFILIKAKLFLFEEKDVDGFETEITSQDLDFISNSITAWEQSRTNPIIQDIFDHLKKDGEIYEQLPDEAKDILENEVEQIKSKDEQVAKKAALAKAKLVLLKQKKKASEFLDSL